MALPVPLSVAMKEAVILFGHGTVENLDDLPAFVTNIRRGHPPPPELLAELRRRYEAIGGQSPFNTTARALAANVERELGIPTRIAMRLWHPYPQDVLRELAATGVERVAFVPLAQHSGAVYAEAARTAAKEVGVEVVCAPDWGNTPALLDAYTSTVQNALERLSPEVRAATTTLFSAHSLPTSIIAAGDAYETEFRASVAGVLARLASAHVDVRPMIAFQSQGPAVGAGGRPIAWLGPDLAQSLDGVRERGDRHVLFAPIGFLADHVEVLYDLDVEAKHLAETRGLTCSRSESLNASEPLVRVVAALARSLLATGSAA